MAHQTLIALQGDAEYSITQILIDNEPDLIELYGEQVPVIHIDGKPHDYFRVDPVRFLAAVQK